MAISKVILNGTILMDVTTDTVAADKLLSSYTATKNDGTKITGTLQASSLKTAQGYTTYDSTNYLWTLTFSNLTNSPNTFFMIPNTPNLAAGYPGYTYYGSQFSAGNYSYTVICGSYDGTNSAFYAVNGDTGSSTKEQYAKLLDDNYDPLVSWSYSNGALTMTCSDYVSIQGMANLYLNLIQIGQLSDGTTPADYILYYT